MAYHDQDMPFNTKDNMQRLFLQTTTTAAGTAGAGAVAKSSPTWLNNAILQQQSEEDDDHQVAVSVQNNSSESREDDWETVKCKAEILGHPLYEQLLTAHVSCLRIATPVDQLPRIDAQLTQSQEVMAKYSALGNGQLVDNKDLDQFMVGV